MCPSSCAVHQWLRVDGARFIVGATDDQGGRCSLITSNLFSAASCEVREMAIGEAEMDIKSTIMCRKDQPEGRKISYTTSFWSHKDEVRVCAIKFNLFLSRRSVRESVRKLITTPVIDARH